MNRVMMCPALANNTERPTWCWWQNSELEKKKETGRSQKRMGEVATWTFG